MAMPLAVPRYTVEDLESFPDDGNRYELLDGILLVSPAPLPPHELVVQRLTYELTLYLGKQARVFTHGAVQLLPRTSLEPDLLVLPAHEPVRRTWARISGWWLAIEVSGKGSRIYDRDFKHAAYLRLGVREAWRADLAERCVYVIRSPDEPVQRCEDWLVWHPPEFAQPFRVEIGALFQGIDSDD
jgi:Uma2 family endonuclease